MTITESLGPGKLFDLNVFYSQSASSLWILRTTSILSISSYMCSKMDCILRDVFRNYSKIHDGTFCENNSTINHWQNLKEPSNSH